MNHKHIKKLTEIEGYLLDEIEFCQENAKKNETIRYNHRHCGHKPNCISSDQ